MRYLFAGGQVVTAGGVLRADVLTEDEKILAVGLDLPGEGAETVDAAGLLLLPGGVDAHTHFDLDVCNTTTADDFASGSQAALLGGTTTVIDFACPNKGESLAYGLALWHKKAGGKTACDYGFHMTVDDWNGDIRRELPQMMESGVTSFKMYMTYPAMLLPDRELFEALEALGELGAVVGVHCENPGLIDSLQARYARDGALGPASHPRTRPDLAEAEAVSKLLKLAKAAGTPVVIVHLSSAAALEEVEAARAHGQKVWVETCPQYLLMDDSRYEEADFRGARYICAPPLRKPRDCAALWDALAKGQVQTVSTDHCSFTLEQKAAGREDFRLIPGGMPGVETRLLAIYSQGVCTGRLTPEQMVMLTAENPARLYGLWGHKGAIAPGFDADLVLLDPQGVTRVRDETAAGNAGYAPLDGTDLRGRITQVWLRGRQVVADGAVLVPDGGRFLAREKGEL